MFADKGESIGEPFRVLVLDDDPIALKSLTYTLESTGMHVWSLTSPFGVSRLVLEHDIEVIVMDLMMPALRGDRIAGLLRENPRLTHVSIVIVSAEPEESLRQVAIRTSVAAIRKANVAEELVSTVRRLALDYRHAGGSSELEQRPACVSPGLRDGIEEVPEEVAASGSRARTALLQEFLQGIPARVVSLSRAWVCACDGQMGQLGQIRRELHGLKGEAYLLSHAPLARLLEEIELAVKTVEGEPEIPSCLARELRAAFNAMYRTARAGQAPGYVDVDAAIARIDHARELAVSGSGGAQWADVARRAQRLLSSLIPPPSSGTK